MKRIMMLAAAAAMMVTIAAGAPDFAKFDPRMAESKAEIDTNGVKWIDGKYLPMEGRAFDNTESYYHRLPAGVTTNVNAGVRGMKAHTAGMQFRFHTDSKFIMVRYEALSGNYNGSGNLTGVGKSGWDMYAYRKDLGLWRFVATSHCSRQIANTRERIKRVGWSGGDCIINLPLYDGVRSIAIGIEKQATITAIEHKSGVVKPVVFYGTSITHGGCASRPGLSFVNIIGRDLDIPIVNLGFSGSGWMEFEMSEHLAAIDASCYVLDCLWNMSATGSKQNRNVDRNYEPFVRNLRAKRPGVPIIFAEACDVFRVPGDKGGRFEDKNRIMRDLFAKLVAEGWDKIYYLPSDDMYQGLDAEGTVDETHPNDLGMITMAKSFEKAVRKALGLK